MFLRKVFSQIFIANWCKKSRLLNEESYFKKSANVAIVKGKEKPLRQGRNDTVDKIKR